MTLHPSNDMIKKTFGKGLGALKAFGIATAIISVVLIAGAIGLSIWIDNGMVVKKTGDTELNVKIENELERYNLLEINTESDFTMVAVRADNDQNEDELLKLTAEIVEELKTLNEIVMIGVIWKPAANADPQQDRMRVFVSSDDLAQVTVKNYKQIPELVFDYYYK